jgi:hypothetical protein
MPVHYALPLFSHTRWIHSWICAGMAEIILARNGFTLAERAPLVLAIAYHDVATPAGGDSVKRVDPGLLDEENNFAYVLGKHGLVERWSRLYGFDVNQASAWVKNLGVGGRLLDVIDKMSYVSLDCYYIGWMRNNEVGRHCLAHPLFMDVWQEIRFTPDKQRFAFTDPDRLYQFLLARAYVSQELYFSPRCRILDFELEHLVRPLFAKGLITKENLLDWDFTRLQLKLAEYYAQREVMPLFITPDDYCWQKFSNESEMTSFCAKLDGTVYHTECLHGFDTCLDWPVFTDRSQTEIVPLITLLRPEQIRLMEKIKDSVSGYYVYWHPPTP